MTHRIARLRIVSLCLGQPRPMEARNVLRSAEKMTRYNTDTPSETQGNSSIIYVPAVSSEM